MATISALRETLRTQIGDITRIATEKRFDNALLNQALFEGLRQHNKNYTWVSVPVEEEQLILILAKIRIARDKALEYALDVRVRVGANYESDKTTNATILLQIAQALEDEYAIQSTRVESQSSISGDIVIGNLVRDSKTIHAKVPTQIAPPPPRPTLLKVDYLYYANAMVHVPSDTGGVQPLNTPTGRLVMYWSRIDSADLAYLRFYASQNPRAPLETWTVVRTIYDYYSDTLAFERVTGPWISTGEAQMAKQELWMEHTLLPTGTWYFVLAAVNWNMLANLSAPVMLRVENALDLMADTVILGD